MIIGLGNDIVNVSRIERMINMYGQKFISRIFTADEIAAAELSTEQDAGNKMLFYAKCFAAKEACIKALGTRFSKDLTLRDISLISDKLDKPLLKLKGKAQKLLQQKISENKAPKLELSLTDDHPLTHAVVIFSSVAAK